MGDYESLRKMLPVANEKTGTVTIKGICDNNIRRIPILQTPTYDELCFMMHRMFRQHLSTNLDNLVLFYKDEDGDQVLITDDMDISHALTHSSVLRITVYDKECLPPPNARSDLSSALKNLSLSSKSLAELKVSLQDVQKAVESILKALPAEEDVASPSNTKSSEQVPKMKPLTTADMAEFLDSGHGKNPTTGSSSAAPMESKQLVQSPLSTQSHSQQSEPLQQNHQQQPQQRPSSQADGSPYNLPAQPPYMLPNTQVSPGSVPGRDHAQPMHQHQQQPPQRHSVSSATGYHQYTTPGAVPFGPSPLAGPPQQPQPQAPPQQYGQSAQRPYSYVAAYPGHPQASGPPSSSPFSQPQQHAPYYYPQGQDPQSMRQHPRVL